MNLPLRYMCDTCLRSWSENYCDSCGKMLRPRPGLSDEARMTRAIGEARALAEHRSAHGHGYDL